MYPDQNAVFMYVDGSALPTNPGSAGFGVYIEFPDTFEKEPESFSKSFTQSTNQRMELRAGMEAMRIAIAKIAEWKKQGASRVVLVTDATYVFHHQSNAEAWRKNGWRSVGGQPIENRDLWQEFINLRRRFTGSIEWEEGKTSEALRVVDKLAKAAARNTVGVTDSGFVVGNISRTLLQGVTTPCPIAEGIIRIYKYKLVGSEYRVGFEVWNEGENVFTGKHHAFAEQKLRSHIHRHLHAQVSFDPNPAHPQILSIEPWVEK